VGGSSFVWEGVWEEPPVMWEAVQEDHQFCVGGPCCWGQIKYTSIWSGTLRERKKT